MNISDTFHPAPLLFTPYLKSVIWGGDKICTYKGLDTHLDGIGESWEISAVPGHESVVAEGEYKGSDIAELAARYGEALLGKRSVARYGRVFPLLIKLIDATANLSVQVHPDDALARKRHNSLGKTEMWYIIATEPGARIYSGLNRELTPGLYTRMVAEGTFAEAIAAHTSRPGDVFFLPAGRVHAIGAGNLLAEIQESSDITYRIYDYDRRDADGNARELHTELAKDAIDYKVWPDYRTPAPDPAEPDAIITECDHFTSRRVIVAGDENELRRDADSFMVVMCVAGEATLSWDKGSTRLHTGTTALLPASLPAVTVSGQATLLTAQV